MSHAPHSRLRDQRGITLTELAVTLALFGMIMVGVVATWQKTQEAYFVGSEAAEVQQNVRSAIDFMVRELRATGRDVTVCAFDYDATGGGVVLDCTTAKRDACRDKLNGSPAATSPYNSCASIFAVPYSIAGLTSQRITIRSDRNDNGTIGVTANPNNDSLDEDVTYFLDTGAGCTGGGSCIKRQTGASAAQMVSVDIAGFQLTYYPRPGYPPCANVPPQNPCPAFAPGNQRDADNIGRIGITVTALTTIGGQQISRTLKTDVVLKNRA